MPKACHATGQASRSLPGNQPAVPGVPGSSEARRQLAENIDAYANDPNARNTGAIIETDIPMTGYDVNAWTPDESQAVFTLVRTVAQTLATHNMLFNSTLTYLIRENREGRQVMFMVIINRFGRKLSGWVKHFSCIPSLVRVEILNLTEKRQRCTSVLQRDYGICTLQQDFNEQQVGRTGCRRVCRGRA